MKVWFQNRRTKNKREVTEDGQPTEGSKDGEKGGDENMIEYDEEDDYVDHHQEVKPMVPQESHHV